MALPKLFERIIWHNNTTPAINEDNLNAMSKAIDDIDDRVILIGDDVVTVIPQIQAYLEQAESIVEAVEELSQNPPYIGSNGNWWVFDTTLEAYKDSGVDASITVDIADITMIAEGAQPYVTNTGTNTDPIFHLFLPRSPQGATGNGISNIAKTSTQGLVDTYTITMTDGTTSTFTVTNGAGDMNKSVYDPTNAIANAGGMKSAAAKNSTNAVTENSTDLVESGAVYAKTEPLWDNMMDNGAVNMLPNNATNQGYNGITFTVNDDGTVKVSGTGDAGGVNPYLPISQFTLPKGTYKLSGCPSNQSTGTAWLFLRTTSGTQVGNDIGDGLVFTVSDETVTYQVRLYAYNAATDLNLTFKPMVSLASLNLSYDDYVPYAKSNRELTEEAENKATTLGMPQKTLVSLGAHTKLRITIPLANYTDYAAFSALIWCYKNAKIFNVMLGLQLQGGNASVSSQKLDMIGTSETLAIDSVTFASGNVIVEISGFEQYGLVTVEYQGTMPGDLSTKIQPKWTCVGV